ncbi:uncharacterized protein UTRI_04877_B [Ustilago trichophora]|uniref:Uncharacterized protein n=1 Tax=Ustilago trichophora TaxID=86804 RepID=A0A5C3EFE7_9BASI|nr:uncharacterized protein UTRI_04877_B [Ustilago trichophora]
MVRLLCRILLPACVVFFATLAWALEKRTDDDTNLDLSLAPPSPRTRTDLELSLAPPAPFARSASAGHSVPMRPPPVRQLRPLSSFPPTTLQAERARIHAEYGRMLALAPSGMSPGRNEETVPLVHDGRPAPPVRVYDVPSAPFPQSGRMAPLAQPGREPWVRSEVANVGDKGKGPKLAGSKRKGDGAASSSSSFRKKVVGTSRTTPNLRGIVIGQGEPRVIPTLPDTSTTHGDPLPQFRQNEGHGSVSFHGAVPLGSELPQMSRAEALELWNQYRDVHLDQSLPRTVADGTFYPGAGLMLQKRIDQLNHVKLSLLRHNRVGLTEEEWNTLRTPFNNWRDPDTLSDGYPREATQTITERAQHDQKLLKDVESILRRIVPEIWSDFHL